MSFLNIKIGVEITYKPIYNPLKSQMLSISIAQSEISEMLLNYLEGKINKSTIEAKISQVLPNYKLSIGDKEIGNPKISGERTIIEAFANNKRIKIEVVV
ncbi:MAG: hypothetical protein QXU74_01835 [Candidatus Aenigmatarchaeota archaeon]